ncbi:MAG: hypothetical protein ACI857_000341 [Arenicella sp.]
MKKITHILFSSALILGLNSCTPEIVNPDQDKIHISLDLKYNRSLDKTSAVAAFRQDDLNSNKIGLNNDASISFKDETLIFGISDKCYSKEFIGNVSGDFKYIDLDSDEVSNSVQMVDSLTFFLLTDSQSVSNEMILEIFMSQLEADEQLQIEFVNAGADHSSTLYSDTYIGTVMQITSAQISDIPAGQVIVIVKRVKYLDSLDHSKLAGGQLTVTYEVQDTMIFF